VTVRINIEGRTDGETMVSVHGWIEGDDEAREVLRVVKEAHTPVVLDLGELQTADTSGLAVLNALAAEGVRLSRASDFIKLLLGSNSQRYSKPARKPDGGAP